MSGRFGWLVVAGWLAGCAAAPSKPGPGAEPAVPPGDEAAVAWMYIVGFDAQLDQGLAAQQAPTCAYVCELVGNICSLGEHICTLAARNPGDAGLASMCRDGRGRCQHARERAQKADCPCQS
jgi:hypothetical protein